MLEELRPRLELILEADGKPVVDGELAEILRAIKSVGSLLRASRALGLPYSRVWDRIARAERELGTRLIEARRGGREKGGARLTEAGERVLELYEKYERALGARPLARGLGEMPMPDLVVAGSHDLLLELLVGRIRVERRLDVEVSWIGSAGGLAALMLGDADVAGSHLYDEETGEYNEPFLDKYWLRRRVEFVGHYFRELGLAYRPDKPVRSIRDLLEGGYRLANRNPGSGTRHVLEIFLRREGVGVEEAARLIPGFDSEYRTHTDAVEAVARGEADVALTLRAVAKSRGLEFTSVLWERYDLIALKKSLGKSGVRALVEVLHSDSARELASRLPGYRLSEQREMHI